MPVTLFFRKSIPGFFSIERLFQMILPDIKGMDTKLAHLPFKSASHPTKIIKNLQYTIRHKSAVNHITGEVYYVALALPGKSTILTIHDIESLRNPNWIKNFLLELLWLKLPVMHTNYVTVISEHSKQKLLEATGINADKVLVIPNCINFTEKDFKPRYTLASDVPVLLQIGTKPNKNLETLIKAILNFPCKLLILGKLSDEQRNLLIANKIDYENYFDLSDDEVKVLYHRADMLTFVSTYEGFGLPILEANAYGLPVITSNTTAMPEVSGNAAVLVDPLNPHQILEAIIKLTQDKALRERLISNGLENIKRFRPEVVAAQYEALYKHVLSENGKN